MDRALTAKVKEINRRYKRTEISNLDRLLELLDQEAKEKIGKFRRGVAYLEDEIRIKWSQMGKLQSVAERIRDTKRRLEGEADNLAKKLDALEAKAPAAFDRGHQVLDQHNADLDAMDSELRQLSNLPLGE